MQKSSVATPPLLPLSLPPRLQPHTMFRREDGTSLYDASQPPPPPSLPHVAPPRPHVALPLPPNDVSMQPPPYDASLHIPRGVRDRQRRCPRPPQPAPPPPSLPHVAPPRPHVALPLPPNDVSMQPPI